MLGYGDILYFGKKHYGKRVDDILEEDPDYIVWLIENTGVKFDNEIVDLVQGFIDDDMIDLYEEHYYGSGYPH